MDNDKPIVANIHDTFFKKSETFIYNNLTNLVQFKPVCLAFNFINLDNFPFDSQNLYYFNKKRFYDLTVGIAMNRNNDAVELLKRLPAKLIHAHFGHIGFHSLDLKNKCNIPLVTNFYDFDASKLPRKNRWKRNYKVLFKQGDLFLVEGKNMAQSLINLGCPEEKIKIQRIALRLEKILFRPRKPKDNQKVILLFSGRFVEKKGLVYALSAINKVRENFSNFEFRIIGDGPQKQDIVKTIRNYNLGDMVKMLGFLNYDNYIKEMSKADIFIHPSITASDGDSEGGAPTTILEAQAMGMPVISTYHADIPNITVAGKSALLSKEKDVDSLTNHLAYLLKNQGVWQEMGTCGRKFIEKYHDVKIEIRKLENKYNQLVV
ncbi:MAG: glycosyltransferase [Actinobacteria bacterium]|nr:MAG: glycosyltransferase [Actinomycetota bacterium]